MKCVINGKVLKQGVRDTKTGKKMYWYCVLPEEDIQSVFINSMSDLQVKDLEDISFSVNCRYDYKSGRFNLWTY